MAHANQERVVLARVKIGKQIKMRMLPGSDPPQTIQLQKTMGCIPSKDEINDSVEKVKRNVRLKKEGKNKYQESPNSYVKGEKSEDNCASESIEKRDRKESTDLQLNKKIKRTDVSHGYMHQLLKTSSYVQFNQRIVYIVKNAEFTHYFATKDCVSEIILTKFSLESELFQDKKHTMHFSIQCTSRRFLFRELEKLCFNNIVSLIFPVNNKNVRVI